jgi:hypothetical protein
MRMQKSKLSFTKTKHLILTSAVALLGWNTSFAQSNPSGSLVWEQLKNFQLNWQAPLQSPNISPLYLGKTKLNLTPTSLESFSLGQVIYGKVPELNAQFTLNNVNGKISGEIISITSRLALDIQQNTDGFLELIAKPIEKELCEQPAPPKIDTSISAPPPALTTPSNLNTLQSLAGAPAVVYIDRDGETVTDTWWTSNYNSGNSFIVAAPTISDVELYQIWLAMAEDYRPFNVNITTDINVYNAATKRKKIIVTSTSNWQSLSTTGIARIGGFKYSSPSFCFPLGFGSTPSEARGYKLAEVCSHEVGHSMGLTHDGDASTNYYNGHGTSLFGHSELWGPIMGSTYYTDISHWSKGEYTGANNTQDDITIISGTNNGFGYRVDDHGNNINNATPLIFSSGVLNSTQNYGVIETPTDVDLFSFTSTGGSVNLTLSPTAYKPNLDAKLELLDASGNIVAFADPASVASATLNQNIGVGNFFLRISGVGYLAANSTGYSNYGSLGEFTITGTIPTTSSNSSIAQSSSTTPSSSTQLSSSTPLSSVAISSSATLSSSSSTLDCSNYPAWQNKSYDWVANKEYVVWNSNLWSHKEWVGGEPGKDAGWTLEKTCILLSSSQGSSSSSIATSSSTTLSSSNTTISSSQILSSSSGVVANTPQVKTPHLWIDVNSRGVFPHGFESAIFVRINNINGKTIFEGMVPQNGLEWKKNVPRGQYLVQIHSSIINSIKPILIQ